MSTKTEISKIPPAETFILNKKQELEFNIAPTPKQVEEWLIEFAKLHVAEAIEKASKGFKNADNVRYVKKCYPLEGIV